MGGCVSATPEEREAKTRSSVIERQLRRDARDYENTIKILLLGAGESGKSTVVKQMKIIHGDGYSESELRSFKSVIYGNLAASMRVVLNAMEKLGIPYANQASQEHARVILSLSNSLSSYETFPPEVTTAFIRLWRDAGVQECFSRAYDYQLNDSAPYYFENMDRLLREDYVPDEQDVLRSRVQTTGIIETSFRVKQLTYRSVFNPFHSLNISLIKPFDIAHREYLLNPSPTNFYTCGSNYGKLSCFVLEQTTTHILCILSSQSGGCRRSEVRETEVDPMFRRRESSSVCVCPQWVRHDAF
jgi:hypothetical protein